MTANKEKEIPSQVLNFDKIRSEETKPIDPKNLPAKLLDRLPKPTGWRILVLPYQGTGKTKGGILLADETVEMHQVATVCGYVLRMGPDAYKDEKRFAEGPWCKEKDWVIFGRYAGSRLKIEGGEIRLLNDDEILATISNPEDILHLF
jgi:chaperonin GroES|tara:strand:+ start:124 stop:567 length:444 start_codon:yes stop_codon:yes gene_type:complete